VLPSHGHDGSNWRWKTEVSSEQPAWRMHEAIDRLVSALRATGRSANHRLAAVGPAPAADCDALTICLCQVPRRTPLGTSELCLLVRTMQLVPKVWLRRIPQPSWLPCRAAADWVSSVPTADMYNPSGQPFSMVHVEHGALACRQICVASMAVARRMNHVSLIVKSAWKDRHEAY
jgi:hypothetical protein